MGIGDWYPVEQAGCEDLYYVDIGLYGTAEYGVVYVVDAERPALVDTGTGLRTEAILDAMAAIGIDPTDLAVIAPTHLHLDHAGGTGHLAESCPNAEIVVHERGAGHLRNPERVWEGTKTVVGDRIKYYEEPRPVPEERIHRVTDGDVVDLGDHTLGVHHMPGHAPHHATFYDRATDALFAADAAGIYVPALDTVEPTTPPPNFDLELALEDVGTCETIEPTTLLYTHYGPAPTDDRLGRYADVLADWVERVATKREEIGRDEGVVEHFADRAADRDELVAVWGEAKARAEAELNVRGVLTYLDERDG